MTDALDRYLDEHRDRFGSERRELCAIPSKTGNAAKASPRTFRVDGRYATQQ